MRIQPCEKPPDRPRRHTWAVFNNALEPVPRRSPTKKTDDPQNGRGYRRTRKRHSSRTPYVSSFPCTIARSQLVPPSRSFVPAQSAARGRPEITTDGSSRVLSSTRLVESNLNLTTPLHDPAWSQRDKRSGTIEPSGGRRHPPNPTKEGGVDTHMGMPLLGGILKGADQHRILT